MVIGNNPGSNGIVRHGSFVDLTVREMAGLDFSIAKAKGRSKGTGAALVEIGHPASTIKKWVQLLEAIPKIKETTPAGRAFGLRLAPAKHCFGALAFLAEYDGMALLDDRRDI